MKETLLPKKRTNDDPELNLNLESGKQKDFIIRCLLLC